MRKLVYLFLICLLSMMMVGCKSKQKVVETVQYVHDTTFFNKDSVVYRYLTFNGTDEEKRPLGRATEILQIPCGNTAYAL